MADLVPVDDPRSMRRSKPARRRPRSPFAGAAPTTGTRRLFGLLSISDWRGGGLDIAGWRTAPYVKNDRQTKFHIGSMNKMFTAVADRPACRRVAGHDAGRGGARISRPGGRGEHHRLVLLHHTALGDIFVPEFFEPRKFVNRATISTLLPASRNCSSGPDQVTAMGYVLLDGCRYASGELL